MKLGKVTIDQVMNWRPCPGYTPEVVKKLFGRRKYITALQVLDLDIPPKDRLWAALHEELIDAKTLRLFACHEASLALHRARRMAREPDKRSWTAIKVARAFAHGRATREELAAAADAAWAATAGVAAASAADAAWYAARYAAMDAERKRQVLYLKKVLTEDYREGEA